MAPPTARSNRFPLILLAVLAIVSVVLGISPHYRSDWLLENVISGLMLLALVLSARAFPLSNVSYSLLFVFFVLHQVGAHYTYSEVPYDAWFAGLTGHGLNELLGFQRNHYDRLVHFSYGLLLAYPVRELFVRVADARGFWGYALPLDVVMSTSMLYELFEWAAAEFFGGELGAAYLGSQGDPWDAQKDMLLASSGAALSLTIAAFIHRRLNRDFQREWAASLRVKHPEPLGEVAVERMRRADGR